MRLFLGFLLVQLIPLLVRAQTNYVANSANSPNPGTNNTLVGPKAGNSSITGHDNAFLGYLAGNDNTSGSSNAFFGSNAGQDNKNGYYNVFVGFVAGAANTEGHENTFIGTLGGYYNTLGSYNTFLGTNAGTYNSSGTYNTFLGYKAGYNNTEGTNNIIIGPNSGTAITTGSDNVLMGYNSQAEDGLHNAIAIGSGSRVASSNALILGHQVNVGIGTSSPRSHLEIISESAHASGLRLSNLTAQSPARFSSDQFLTVNEEGEVVKARYQLRIYNVTEWSDHVFSSTYRLQSLAAVEAYIGQYAHLPGLPSAEQLVGEGADLVKMTAALLAKIEELTLYSIQLEKTNRTFQQQLQRMEQQQQQITLHQQTKIEAVKQLIKQFVKNK